jgi:hypothetical protein
LLKGEATRGHSPDRKPETQWILLLIKEFNPVVIVCVHAPYAVLFR